MSARARDNNRFSGTLSHSSDCLIDDDCIDSDFENSIGFSEAVSRLCNRKWGVAGPAVVRSMKAVAVSNLDSPSKSSCDADSDGESQPLSCYESDSENQPATKPAAKGREPNQSAMSAATGGKLNPIELFSDSASEDNDSYISTEANSKNEEPGPPVARHTNLEQVPQEISCDSAAYNKDGEDEDPELSFSECWSSQSRCDSDCEASDLRQQEYEENENKNKSRKAKVKGKRKQKEDEGFILVENGNKKEDEEWVPDEKKKKTPKKRAKGKRKQQKKEEELFVVEDILEQEILEHGGVRYKVRWRGYNEKDDSYVVPETMSEDLLVQAFSKFPRVIQTVSGETIEEDCKYREKDLERCTEFYDEWKNDHPEKADGYVCEVKTAKIHLRIGMWYESSGKLLLVAALNSEHEKAKCLVFVPSTICLKNNWQEEYFCIQTTEVEFDRLSIQCKDPPPNSHWRYTAGEGEEFELSSSNKKCEPVKDGQTPYYLAGPPNVLVLGAGSVGMSEYEVEEWNVAWQVENDRNAADSLRRNYFDSKHSKLFVESIDSFLTKVKRGMGRYTFRDKDGIKEEVDHIHISTAHKSHGEKKAMSEEFIECVKWFKPKSGMYDSTTDLFLSENIDIYRALISELLKLEYQMKLVVLDASDYGDPIMAERVVLWFAEETLHLPTRPKPTHGKGTGKGTEKDVEKVTVEDALDWLKDVEPCESLNSVEVDGEDIYNHCISQHKPTWTECATLAIEPKEQATDFTGTDKIIHFSKKRFLTIREYMCLKSFDDKYELHGSEEEQIKIVAEAMPWRMATGIARSILLSYGVAS